MIIYDATNAIKWSSNKAISNCVRYNRLVPTCIVCKSGYKLSSDSKSCIPINQVGCSAVDSTGKCTGCLTGYSLSSDSLSCAVNDINGCYQYNTVSTCSKCLYGYTLSADKLSCSTSVTPSDQIYTAIGLVRLQNTATLPTIQSGWRLLTKQQILYANVSFTTRLLESTSKYCYSTGTFQKTNGVFVYTDTVSSCNYNLIKPTYEPDNCLVFNGSVCSSCVDGYTLSADKTYCYSNVVFKYVAFTYLGQIKVLGYNRQQLPSKWRALTLN